MKPETGNQSSKGGRPRRWVHAFAALVAVGALYLSGVLFAPLESALTDFRFAVAEKQASGELIIVAIDQRSLDTLGKWPWPRNYHATVLDRLREAGAAELALDIDLSSYSTPAADAALEAALARAGGRVILPVIYEVADDSASMADFVFTAPLPEFRRQGRIASVNTKPDQDGVNRRHSLASFWQNDMVVTMPALMAAGRGASYDTFHIDFGIRVDTIPRLSYADVMNGTFDPAVVRGRKVIIGTTAAELGEPMAVPRYKTLPEPVVQALAFESLVQQRTMYRSEPWLVLICAVILAFCLSGVFLRWSWRRGLAVVVATGVLSIALSVAVQASAPVMLEVTPWIAVVLFLFCAGLAGRVAWQDLFLALRGGRLRQSSGLMRSVVESSSEAILTISSDLIVELANPAAERLFGAAFGKLDGISLAELLPTVTGAKVLEPWLENEQGETEVEGVRQDGSEFPLEISVDAMVVDAKTYYVLVARDISVRKVQQTLLEYLALHDPLTSLPNRTLLVDRLEHAIATSKRESSPLALLILDLDRFKEINDTLGHAVGDSLLAEVGQKLSGPLRDSDTIARLGGDEFAILLPSVTGLGQARDVAERIAATTNQSFPVEDLMLEVGVSIGIALFPEHGETASDLMRSADVAMYMAKRDDASIAVYDEEKDHNSLRNLSMSGDLRRAMDEDELVLYFQPQIETATGNVTGVEALVRWQHIRYGLVPPSEFITLAERCGLIGPLTRWVLGKSTKCLGAWQAEGYDIGLSMNLSPRNLREEDLAGSVARLMKRRGVRPGSLTMEITEDAIMTDPERAAAAIQDLKECGVRIAIDDFGTGHSSLAYLKTLPVDELKIDKSFVIHMTQETSDAVIVRSTIDLAHNLGLSVVAEGIESEEHLQALRDLGCDVGQGFHIARPMPHEVFDKWLKERMTAIPASGDSATVHPLRAARRNSV